MLRYILILTTFLLFTDSAFACSCGSQPSIQVEIDNADTVFIGRVIESGLRSTEFEILTPLKAADFETIIIKHWQPHGGNCGVAFSKDETMHIVAHKNSKGSLYVDMCSSGFSTEDYTQYVERDGDYIGLSHSCALEIHMAYAWAELNDQKMVLKAKECEAVVPIYYKRFRAQ